MGIFADTLKQVQEENQQTEETTNQFDKFYQADPVQEDDATLGPVLKEWGKGAGRRLSTMLKGILNSYDLSKEEVKDLNKIGYEGVFKANDPNIGVQLMETAAQSDFLRANKEVLKDMSFMDQFLTAALDFGVAGGLSIATRKPRIGAAYMGTQIMGGHIENLVAQGVDLRTATKYGFINMATQLPMESFGLTKATALWRFKAAIVNRIKDTLIASGAEGATEVMQVLPEVITEVLAKDASRTTLEAVWEALSNPETYKQMGIEGGMGAIFGFVIGAGGAIKNKTLAEAAKDVKESDTETSPDIVEHEVKRLEKKKRKAEINKKKEVVSEFKKPREDKPAPPVKPEPKPAEIIEDEIPSLAPRKKTKDLRVIDPLVERGKALDEKLERMVAEKLKPPVEEVPPKPIERLSKKEIEENAEKVKKDFGLDVKPKPVAEKKLPRIPQRKLTRPAIKLTETGDIILEPRVVKSEKVEVYDSSTRTGTREETITYTEKVKKLPEDAADAPGRHALNIAASYEAAINKANGRKYVKGMIVDGDFVPRSKLKKQTVIQAKAEKGQERRLAQEVKKEENKLKRAQKKTEDVEELLRQDMSQIEESFYNDMKGWTSATARKIESKHGLSSGELEGDALGELFRFVKKANTDSTAPSIKSYIKTSIRGQLENKARAVVSGEKRGTTVSLEAPTHTAKEGEALTVGETTGVKQKTPEELFMAAQRRAKEQAKARVLLGKKKLSDRTKRIESRKRRAAQQSRMEALSEDIEATTRPTKTKTRIENIANKIESGATRTWWRGQRDVPDLEHKDVGFHLAIDKRVSQQYFVKKKTDALKELSTGKMKVAVIADPGAGWDKLESVYDAITVAKREYSGANKIKLAKLESALKKAEGELYDPRKFTNPIEYRQARENLLLDEQIIKKGFADSGLDGLLYTNPNEKIKGLKKADNISIVVFDDKKIKQVKEKNKVISITSSKVRKKEPVKIAFTQIEKVVQPHPNMKVEPHEFSFIEEVTKEWEETFYKLSSKGRKKVIGEAETKRTGKVQQTTLKELHKILRAERRAKIKIVKPTKKPPPKKDTTLYSGVPYQAIKEKLLGPFTRTYDKYIGKPTWKALSEKAPYYVASKSDLMDTIFTGIIEDFGKDALYKELRHDQRINNSQWKQLAKYHETKIENIDKIFRTNTRLKEVSQQTLEKRMKQIAEGSITEFDEKFEAVREASASFNKLEKELQKAGMLPDHQFRSLSRKERAAALKEIRKWDKEIEGIKKLAADEPLHIKTEKNKLAKAWKERNDLIVRLQIHYKNSGVNYLRYIYEKMAQTQTFVDRYRDMAIGKKWALRRKNWVVEADNETGIVKVERQRPELRTPKEKVVFNDKTGVVDVVKDTSKIRKFPPMAKMIRKGVSEEAHDLHVFELFNNIAGNEKWASKEARKGTVPLPRSESYGPLAGMHVEKHIANDIKEVFEVRKAMGKLYDLSLSKWKSGKVVWNPSAQARNLMSNKMLMDMVADIPLSDQTWMKDIYKLVRNTGLESKALANNVPIKDIKKIWGKKGDPWYDLKYRTNIYDTTFAKADLETFTDIFGDLGLEMSKKGDVVEFLQKLGKKLKVDTPSKIFQMVEQGMKTNVYLKSRAAGKSHMASARLAEKSLFDYGNVPPVVRWAKRFYSPFITFMYKSTPRFGEMAVRKPWKLAKYYALWKGMEELSRIYLGETPEQLEEEKRLQPEYMHRDMLPGMPSHVKLPLKDGDVSKYWDLSYITPWGDMTESWGNASIGVRMIAPQHPALTFLGELGHDETLFLKKPLTLKHDDGGEKMLKIMAHAWKTAAPGLPLPGTDKWNKLMAGIYGDKNWTGRTKYSVGEAVFDVALGIKIRSLDPNTESMWRSKEISEEIQSIRKEYSDTYNNIYFKKAGRYTEEQQKQLFLEATQKMNEELEEVQDKAAYHFNMERESDIE